jgi:DNA-binding transcriptional MerR regulator
MYSIGEFSKINNITPKTLRHYDRIGLLKPDRVNDWTGYRYSSGSQLPLDEIGMLLKENAHTERILQQHIQESQSRLCRTIKNPPVKAGFCDFV